MSRENNPSQSLLSYPLNLKMYLILAAISLFFLFYAIWEMKPLVIDISDFLGLTSHLTLAYWIGYILIIFCSIRLYLDREYKNESLYILILFIYGLFIFGVPVFAEENARFPWSYYPAGEVKTVLESKYIDSFSKYPLLSYRSWPGTHIISASIIYISNIRIDNLLKYMPLFWMFSVIVISFSIARRSNLSLNQSFLASLLTLTSFWQFHYYYGPQSLAYILYILFFLLIFSFSRGFREIILLIITYIALVATHLLTSIALLSSFILSSRYARLGYKNIIKFILLFLIIFIAWYIYIAPVMFESGIREFINQVMRPDIMGFLNTNKYIQGELLSRQITHYSRLSYVLIYAIFMLFAVVLYFFKKVKKENKEFIKLCYAWLFGVLVLFLLRYGASEIDDRVYLFSLIPMILIMILSFNNKVLIIITILLIIPHIPAHYGGESFDQTLTTELSGAEFFAEKIPSSTGAYSYFYSTYLQFYDPKKISMRWQSFTGMHQPNISSMDSSDYIVDSRSSYYFMKYSYGFDPVQLWISMNQNNINLFYDNGYFKNYIRRGKYY